MKTPMSKVHSQLQMSSSEQQAKLNQETKVEKKLTDENECVKKKRQEFFMRESASLPFELDGLYSDLLSREHDIHALEFIFIKKGCDLSLVKFYPSSVQVMYDVTIKSDLMVSVNANGSKLANSHPLFSDEPTHYADVNDVLNLIQKMNDYQVCWGNSDSDFLSLCRGSDSQRVSVVEYYATPHYTETIRSVRCERLTKANQGRCVECRKYRGTLRKLLNRKLHQPATRSKYKPNSQMSPLEMRDKLTHLKKEEKKLNGENKNLKKKMEKLLKKCDSVPSSRLTTAVTKCIEECSTIVKQELLDEQSFQMMSGEEQINLNKCDSQTTMSQCERLTIEAPTISKYKAHSAMSSLELQAKLAHHRKIKRQLAQQNRRLEKKIKKLLEREAKNN